LGSGEDAFIPTAIPDSRGLAAPQALAFGDGQVFFLAQDGMYSQVGVQQTKITETIDPFFLGQTVNGVLPINRTQLSVCRLAYHAHPQNPEVVLLYPESGSTTLNKRLVLKRNPQTGNFTDCFFDDTTGITMQSLYADPRALTLLMGGNNSRVYQAEVDTANTDDGTAIEFAVQTQAYHQGRSRQPKTYRDAVIEANTGGVNVAATTYYNKGNTNESLGNVTGSTDTAQTYLTIPTPATTTIRRNISVRLAASVSVLVKIFKIGFHVAGDAEDVQIVDTDEIVFPTPHILRHLLLDIDNPPAVTTEVDVDRVAIPSQTVVAATGRRRLDLLYSNDSLRRGRVFHMRWTASTPFQLYRAIGLFEPEPLPTTFWDSRGCRLPSYTPLPGCSLILTRQSTSICGCTGMGRCG
jgi:hypothetical protein